MPLTMKKGNAFIQFSSAKARVCVPLTFCAPITDDEGKLVGFVSKTDIIRFDASGEDPTYTRLYEIANPNVVTVSASLPINEAAQKMLQEHVHHLVVMNGGTLAGVLSAFDFVSLAAEFAGNDGDEDITENLFSHVDGS
jgi:CBS domain-containing protein